MKFDYYITGTIGVDYDWWTGTRGTTAKQVRNFLNEHKDKELTIAVSSLGGYIKDGLEIMELIKDHGKCDMVIIGMTASAATILCMKARSVKIARGSLMLIHNSSDMLDIWMSANKEKIDEVIKVLQHSRENLDTIDKCLADIYSMRNGKTVEENLELMAKEKWLSAADAKDFGLVDAVLDDDDIASKAKSVKNAFAGYKDGTAGHYAVPSFEGEKSPGLIERLRTIGRDIAAFCTGEDSEEPKNNPTNSVINMKKLILNLACALLSIEAFSLNEKGEAALTEDQLKTIENGLKEKDDTITNLQAEKKTAEDKLSKAEKERDDAVTAKAAAEQALADLQKQFDDFKKEAGDDSNDKPLDENGKKTFGSAKDLLEDINNLM